jgi:predicted RNA-binding Zn-ribbon protein involved in translation (DUF1610 family)
VESDDDLDVGKVRIPSSASIDDLLDSIAEGKEGDIFDAIKSVGKDGAPADELGSEPSSPPGAAVATVHAAFECPVCGSSVDADARACPSCGAEFAEDAVEEFECPSCGSTVDAAAKACPTCGVTFAADAGLAAAPPPRIAPEHRPPERAPAGRPAPLEVRETILRQRLDRAKAVRAATPPSAPPVDRRALYKELPRLVNEVKPMLLTARKVGVDIEDPKRLINDAIAAGKRRDIDRAVAFVSQAKVSLERSFAAQIGARVDALLEDLEKAKAGGSEVGPVESLLGESISALEAGDFVASSDRLNAAREEFEKVAGGYHRAKEALRAAEALMEDSRVFGIDVRDADKFIRQGREALGKREYESASRAADQATGAIMRVLPDFLNDEMKRARNKLLDLKMRGGDLTRPIGLLKQASIHLKREEYADAMRFVRQFRRETERL